MDEYLTEEKEWIDKDDPLSFRGFMKNEVYDKIDIDLVGGSPPKSPAVSAAASRSRGSC